MNGLSNELSQQIMNNAADGIVTIDDLGQINSFNPAAEKMFGYSAEELIGKNIKCLMPNTHSQHHDNYLKRYKETGKGHIIGIGPREVTSLRSDGSTFPMDLAISEIRQADGQVLYIGILRDITQRKMSEAELRASEQRFELISRGTHDGIWDWDLTEGKIYFSPRWKSMLGYDEGDIKDNFLALQNLMHPDDLGNALDEWMHCMDGETDSFNVEYRLRNKHKGYTWVQCRGTVLRDDDGHPIRMAGSHTDISNRKQAYAVMEHMHRESQAKADALEKSHRELQTSHEQLLQSEKLASIGQLAAGVAHEINNPVGYVYSNLSTLQNYINNLCQMLEGYERLESLFTEEQEALTAVQRLKKELDVEYLKSDVQDLVSESMEGISRVKGIVQDLKDFSHVDEAEWQWTDLHQGLNSTLNIVNNEIKYKAEVVKEYGEIPDVECLVSQINQVFMNLLVNAAHSIEKEGAITIRTGHENNMVWIAVSDTGSGIKAENIKKIFDPFFTTKAIGTGTGLGLSLSYGIVKKHGGDIKVTSAIGKGTTFTVYLPVKQPQEKVDETAEVTT